MQGYNKDLRAIISIRLSVELQNVPKYLFPFSFQNIHLSEVSEAVQGAGDEVQVDPDILQSLIGQQLDPLHIVDDVLGGFQRDPRDVVSHLHTGDLLTAI